jgi:head-tail adaptor
MPPRVTWPGVDPGQFRHPISILQAVKTTDISGTVITWQPYLLAKAAIDPVSGTELLRGGQDTTQNLVRISMWYQPGIDPKMRVEAASGTFRIQHIENPQHLNVILILTCLGLGTND